MKYHIRIIGSILIILILITTIEVGSNTIIKSIISKRASFLVYTPPRIDKANYINYLEERHPTLGWPRKSVLNSAEHDATGSRFVPTFPSPGNECITLYGDSFTYGDEVTAEETWGNILSKLIQCRVANFGVPAYGTDQSLLRFQNNREDKAPISILGLFPLNLLRNVTQYRYLVYTSETSKYSFKPRFILENGQLKLIPLPQLNYSEITNFDSQVDEYLPYETFLPGNGLGPVQIRPPCFLTLYKFAMNKRVHNWLLNNPSWLDFSKPNHPSESLELTVALVKSFIDDCEKRNKRCFVLNIPTPSSFRKYKETGVLSLKPILDELDRLGIEYLSIEPYLEKKLGKRSYCDLVTIQHDCGGHYNPEGNKMVGEILADYIIKNKLVTI